MADATPGPLVDRAEVPPWLRPLLDSTAQLDLAYFGLQRQVLPQGARRAAVLILLGHDGAGPDVLLLRRADGLNDHPGQVAFPGGAVDDEDGGPVQTALREATEEVGVRPQGVRPVATLPELYLPRSDFQVTPVLAYWHEPSPVAAVDPAETAAVARVPMSWLADPANRFRVSVAGHLAGPAFHVPGMLVWGFTAHVLSGVLDLAGWSRAWNHEDVRDLDEAWRAAKNAGWTPPIQPGDARTG